MATAIKGGKGSGAKKLSAPGSSSKKKQALGGTSNRNKEAKSQGKQNLTDEELIELVPAGMAASFVESKLHEKALEVAGLGEPSDWEGAMPELSNEVAGEDHDTLANLLAMFTNAMSSSLWHSSKNYVEADAYEEVADYLESVAILDSKESNDTKRKADAKTNNGVVAARTLQRKCYRNYVRFRDNAKTLEHRMKAVSRIGGFVGDEAEGEDLGSKKSSTRGKSAGSRSSSKGSTKLRSKR